MKWPWTNRKRAEVREAVVLERATRAEGRIRAAEAAATRLQDEIGAHRKFAEQFHERSYRRGEVGTYSVCVTFDARMFSGGLAYSRDQHNAMAHYVSRQVEAEIGSGKYVESAEMARWRAGAP